MWQDQEGEVRVYFVVLCCITVPQRASGDLRNSFENLHPVIPCSFPIISGS